MEDAAWFGPLAQLQSDRPRTQRVDERINICEQAGKAGRALDDSGWEILEAEQDVDEFDMRDRVFRKHARRHVRPDRDVDAPLIDAEPAP